MIDHDRRTLERLEEAMPDDVAVRERLDALERRAPSTDPFDETVRMILSFEACPECTSPWKPGFLACRTCDRRRYVTGAATPRDVQKFAAELLKFLAQPRSTDVTFLHRWPGVAVQWIHDGTRVYIAARDLKACDQALVSTNLIAARWARLHA